MIIGITGKIASGKSSLSSVFVKKGYYLFDSDLQYHKLLKNNISMKSELIKVFSNEIVDNNEINTKLLLKKINRNNINKLNEITHKYVAKEIYKVIKLHDNVVIEAAIPINKGFIDVCDLILLTVCDENIQRQRLLERKKYNVNEIDNLIAIQQKNSEYIKISDYVIETNKLTIEELNNTINLLF